MSTSSWTKPRTLMLSILFSGCTLLPGMQRTPMSPTAVSTLTTCKTGDLSKIKKNLLLAGYQVQDVDEDAIQTDFKQTDGFGGEKMYRKISVVKVDDTTAKFKVRVRTESLEKVQTGEVRDSSGRVVASDSQIVQNDNENDQEYYQEAQEMYAQTQGEVCGGV